MQSYTFRSMLKNGRIYGISAILGSAFCAFLIIKDGAWLNAWIPLLIGTIGSLSFLAGISAEEMATLGEGNEEYEKAKTDYNRYNRWLLILLVLLVAAAILSAPFFYYKIVSA